MSKWVGVGISNTIPKKLAMSYCSWSSPPPFIAWPRPRLNSERVQDTFDLELRSRILHWAWLICIIYRHIWDTQCRSGCRMVLPSFQAVSYDWCAILSANFYTFFQSSCARHEIGPGYWSDNVTICQLVITTSFHSSLLSLITCHITIATSESTFNLTTVILFTRPQSLTLSPSWLEYNIIFFIPTFTVALLSSYGPARPICSGIILWYSPIPKAQWYQLLCLVWQHEGSSASSSPIALCEREKIAPYTLYDSPSWLWRQALCYHLCSIQKLDHF